MKGLKIHHMERPAKWKQEIKAMNGVVSNSLINLMGEIRRVPRRNSGSV